MKKNIIIIIFILLIVSCKTNKGNMVVKGQIKGLKKGTLYLQKMKDTALISVDSVKLFGEDKFTLSDNVTSPVMYYLTFNSNKTERKLMFFGEAGEITIYDKIEEFGLYPTITGSKNQKVIDEFKIINNRFKDKRLNFLVESLKARAKKDSVKEQKIEANLKKMIRRKFLFATNFAINHKNYEAAPYIALSELVNAKFYLLDTINKSLTERVKNSEYGKQLNKLVLRNKAVND